MANVTAKLDLTVEEKEIADAVLAFLSGRGDGRLSPGAEREALMWFTGLMDELGAMDEPFRRNYVFRRKGGENTDCGLCVNAPSCADAWEKFLAIPTDMDARPQVQDYTCTEEPLFGDGKIRRIKWKRKD